MSILSQQDLPVPYPLKIKLSIQFDYAIVDIHNSFDYLEELWDDIVLTITNSFDDREISILKGTTNINEDYTVISYEVIALASPPYINFTFVYDDLCEAELPSAFKISTPNYYRSEENDILLLTK